MPTESIWRLRVPVWVATGFIAIVLGIGLGYGWRDLQSERGHSNNAAPRGPMTSSPSGLMAPQMSGPTGSSIPSQPVVTSETLEPGDRVPQITVAGWLNETPPAIPSSQAQVIVLDVWANWCPFCRGTAPNLVKVFKKYQNQNVSFVSLTNENKESVQRMIADMGIPWPSGFGATMETLRNLGASTASGAMLMGGAYDVKPTLYVVGRDGRVIWSDGHMRYNHRNPDDTASALEAAIDHALSDTGG